MVKNEIGEDVTNTVWIILQHYDEIDMPTTSNLSVGLYNTSEDKDKLGLQCLQSLCQTEACISKQAQQIYIHHEHIIIIVKSKLHY